MKGLYNLAEFGVKIELRIVINQIIHSRLYPMSNFIYNNLPFVNYISFMGMEDIGYTVKNYEKVWIDPEEYQIQFLFIEIGSEPKKARLKTQALSSSQGFLKITQVSKLLISCDTITVL